MNLTSLKIFYDKRILYSFCLICLSFMIASPLYPCTIFSIADQGAVWVGNNEDWKNEKAYIWFVPGNDGLYGSVYFGFNDGYPQGGMNEKGLFFDWAALASREGDVFSPEKPMFGKIISLEIMKNCANVEEALQYFKTYNYLPLRSAHLLISDADGDSAIVELGKNGLEIIRKEKKHQIITNFYITDPDYKVKKACPRYKKAMGLLGDIEVSEKGVRTILQETQQYGPFPTQYSYVLNLAEQKIILYNSHQFETPFAINLHDELKQGKHAYRISWLFDTKETIASSKSPGEFIFLNVNQPVTIKAYESFLFMANTNYKIRSKN